MHIQENQLVPKLLLKIPDTLQINNIDILSMCMKTCHAKTKKIFFVFRKAKFVKKY